MSLFFTEAEAPKVGVVIDEALAEAIKAMVAEGLGTATSAAVFSVDEESGLAVRVADRVEYVESRRQANLEGIFRSAATHQAVDAKSIGRPENGWLGLFVASAQDAESELERDVWSQILAAEMLAPGAVARRTLGFLREMDVWELEAFAEYVAFAFSFESGWRFMFEEDIARREMWSYGREIDITQQWVDIGLLSSQVSCIESVSLRGLRIGYKSKWWQLIPDALGQVGESNEGKANALGYRKFTATGQQVANAVKTKTFNGYARNVMQALNGLDGFRFDAVEPPA